MGIAEIQAALAANAKSAAANPFAAPAPAAPPAAPSPSPSPAAPPTPSPFGAPPTAAANPFGGSMPVTVFQAPSPAPTPAAPPPAAPAQPTSQTSFAFNPPAGFEPASTPPINPPGERASLNTPPPADQAPANALTAEQVAAHTPPAEPRRRTRKGAKNAGGMPGVVAEPTASDELASPVEVVLSSISTEDLVALLRERGYSVWLEAKS